jgi:hypothetical protein
MIAQMQKRAQGISRVGRRLFPNLRMTGLPAAWSQLLEDPITALDRHLASVTSDPRSEPEEDSNGTMIDSSLPPPLRVPNQSRVSPQILGDPITALDRHLASVTSAPAQNSEDGSTGTMIDSSLSSSLRVPNQSRVSPQIDGDPITALDRRLASITSVPAQDSEDGSTGTMIETPLSHTFRQPQQSLASSQIAYDPAIESVQRQAPGISRVGSRLFPDLGMTGLPPACSRVLGDPITALDRLLASVTAHRPAAETIIENSPATDPSYRRDELHKSPAGPATHFKSDAIAWDVRQDQYSGHTPSISMGGDRAPSSHRGKLQPKPNFAAAEQSSSLPKEQAGRTKLVPFSRLAEMLAPYGSAGESSVQPHPLEPTEIQQTAPARSHPPSQAVTVEAVLEQLGQRLQFEFLRTYGSSGE